MGLKNMSLLADASITATGGTALAFAPDGQTVQNGLHLIVPADTDYQTRRGVTFKYRPPTLDPKTNAYTKDKKSVTLTQPIVVNGVVFFNVLRMEREVHPSTTALDATRMIVLGAQMLQDSDVTSFWANGSME